MFEEKLSVFSKKSAKTAESMRSDSNSYRTGQALLRAFAAVTCVVTVTASHAQGLATRPANVANWKLANMFSAESLRPYLYSSTVNATWIGKTDSFWYSWRDSTGNKYWLVDAKARKKVPLFDSDKMAALLTEANFKPVDATTLTVTTITFDEKDDNIMRFVSDGMRYEYLRKEGTLKKLGEVRGPQAGAAPGGQGRLGGRAGGFQGTTAPAAYRNLSPDKKAFVFAQDHNLYYCEFTDEKNEQEGEPVQLTKDGESYYSFGSRTGRSEEFQDQTDDQRNNQQQGDEKTRNRVRANVTWSKDSKRFYVTRSDSRKVKDLWLVNSLSMPRPTLETYKYAMPGEPDVTQQELFTFDRESKTLTKLKVDRYKDQRLFDIHFQDTTSDAIRYVRRDRLQRNLELVETNLKTMETKALVTEKTENAFLETSPIRYVKLGGDFLWFSERSGWGHFYRYSNDGKLLNALTSGPWRSSSVIDVDEKTGTVWVEGNGREKGENAYYRHCYSVKLDGSDLKLLDAGNGDTSTSLSPDKEYMISSSSRIDMPTKSVLRNRNGEVLMELETMDLTRLMEAGWKMPEPFVVKAADGVNDIYGNLWKPADFSDRKTYPIIAYVYPGPQTESVTSTFTATTSLQQLANLGFVVIQIGNRGGNPARSNAYHSFGYYNLREYGLADKKAGIEELGRRYKWIDTDRVGIYGHSGGGFMTAAALLTPPYNDFFKVGVSSAGNHDNNVYNQNWSEQHHGLREVAAAEGQEGSRRGGTATGRTLGSDPEISGAEEEWLGFEAEAAPQDGQGGANSGNTKFEIKVPTNAELAANLKGNLLLVHGEMDNNVHPAGTIRLVDALIKANKRFDFMVMPGQRHGFGPMQGYFQQRLMEYFAEHLLGDYYGGSAEMDVKRGGQPSR